MCIVPVVYKKDRLQCIVWDPLRPDCISIFYFRFCSHYTVMLFNMTVTSVDGEVALFFPSTRKEKVVVEGKKTF